MYVIDTNVISALRRPDRAPGVTDWVRGKPETEFLASVVTLGEIDRGIQLQIPRNREFAVILQAWIDSITIFFGAYILNYTNLATFPTNPNPKQKRLHQIDPTQSPNTRNIKMSKEPYSPEFQKFFDSCTLNSKPI